MIRRSTISSILNASFLKIADHEIYVCSKIDSTAHLDDDATYSETGRKRELSFMMCYLVKKLVFLLGESGITLPVLTNINIMVITS